MISLALVAGATAGAASMLHCAAMCGPLAALPLRSQHGTSSAAYYFAGRAMSYVTAGAIAGSFANAGYSLIPDRYSAFIPSILVALAMWSMAGAEFARWRATRRQPADAPLQSLGKGPRPPSVWMRAVRSLGHIPFALGVLNGLLPCGALLAAWLLAGATGSALGGAAFMAGFVGTSSLALIGAASVLQVLARSFKHAQLMIAVVLVLGGVAAVARPVLGLQQRSCCTTGP